MMDSRLTDIYLAHNIFSKSFFQKKYTAPDNNQYES